MRVRLGRRSCCSGWWPADIDLCMIMGAGRPFHLGGIAPYLDRTGLSERTTGTRFAPKGVASIPE